MRSHRVIVLKFGGSVLRTPADVTQVVHEIYRWLRLGWRIVAVVSAFEGDTDSLLQEALSYGNVTGSRGAAMLAATGELRSAAHLSLALERTGLGHELLDSAAIGLRTDNGSPDASPTELSSNRLLAALNRQPIVVIPGFVGRDRFGRVTLLGRGGSDCTALFVAGVLGSRCRLVKDVAGLYEWDPQAAGPRPKLFRRLSWDHALKLDGTIVQHKAIRAAVQRRQSFEVGSLQDRRHTCVGDFEPQFVGNGSPLRRLRVGMIGAGTVGRGLLRLLSEVPEKFEVAGVAVQTCASTTTWIRACWSIRWTTCYVGSSIHWSTFPEQHT